MRRFAWIRVPFRLALAALGAWLCAACPETVTTTGFTPVTGIVIRSDSLVGPYGCGPERGQVYKYVALVQGDDVARRAGSDVTFGEFDCFADGEFIDLASGDYNVQIYAFDKPTYEASTDALAAARSARDLRQPETLKSRVKDLQPTYRTTCTARSQRNVRVLAQCGGLAVPDDRGAPADAAADAPADGPADAPTGADAQPGPDAGDAGDAADD